MGKLERLRNFRISRYELVFIAASGVMYYGAAHLPTHILAAVCLGSALAVKVVGLPVQIVKIVRDRIPGMSLVRNLLDYQSYLLWGLYGEAIHSSVLVWGQYPGAVLVWIITWLNIRHGSFRWRLKPNHFGHYDADDCKACRYVDLTGRKDLNPITPGHIKGLTEFTQVEYFPLCEKDIPEGQSDYPRNCVCGDREHAVVAQRRFGQGPSLGLVKRVSPSLIVRCASPTHDSYAEHYPRPDQQGSKQCCWYDAPERGT